MADLPISFSGPMVRAILREIEQPGTGKTQTRRVLNPQPYSPESIVYVDQNAGKWMSREPSPVTGGTRQMDPWRKLKCAPGDRLYVREHWRTRARWDDLAPRDMPRDTPVEYVATATGDNYGRFRQAMHMPKWASRITLLVTDVRVERLRDITTSDCFAEGIERPACLIDPRVPMLGSDKTLRDNTVGAFRKLWDSINGDGAWDANPWVVAYTFRPILGNIDQIGEAA